MDKRTSIKPAPFVLVTGFLGSGKTTLIKRLLYQYADTNRIAVIQNEFADANVDGRELKSTGKSFELLEINKGSVFCVCRLSDFKRSLSILVDAYQPEIVVLEATGLADPIAIGQMMEAEEVRTRCYLCRIWCVVDVSIFQQMQRVVPRMRHQVRIADTVILNKTDLATDKQIEEVASGVAVLNPNAEIITAFHCDLALPEPFVPVDFPFSTGAQLRGCDGQSGPRPDISSAVLRTTRKIKRENLERFLNEFEEKVYRIKGYVNLIDDSTVAVQMSFGHKLLAPVECEPGPTELIALGPSIDYDEFVETYKNLTH